MAFASILSDAELHGLVDGHMDPDRRAEVLRRAAASPRDRALVEAWQDQNDLVRAAFAGVEREPLPSALDLRTPPQLHAVPLAVAAAPRRRFAGVAATMIVMAIGLAGSWYVAGLPAGNARLPADRVSDDSRASGDERLLAARTVAALAFGEVAMPATVATVEPSPTATIPDLSGAGFAFTAAEARDVAPRSVIFRYRNAADERIAIGATRAEGEDSAPVPRDSGFTWRKGRVAYAIFGTVAADRLRTIAVSLRPVAEAR